MEVGWDKRCDRIIFIKCDKKIRNQRFQQKSAAQQPDIGIREKKQISLDIKEQRADNTINNNSDLLTLVRQVTEIFTDIVN